MSSASIQAWVDHLGWTAPAIYLALVVFRHFLLIPSTVVIAAGGLCFGATLGAGLGALGIALCGLGQFALVRVLRPRWILSQVDRNVWGLERIIERCKEQNLRLTESEEESKVDFMVFLTVQTMNYLHSGRHRVAL